MTRSTVPPACYAQPWEPQGQRVVVLSRNSAQMLVLHFACVRSGAIFVPLNWRLAKFKVPKRYEIIEYLPRTPSGKVQKYLLWDSQFGK